MIDNARETIELWLETVIDYSGAIPEPSYGASSQSGVLWLGVAMVTVDMAEYQTKRSG